MERFRIVPHGRLQEWVAAEKGYFADAGLDHEFVTIPGFRELGARPAADGGPDEVLYGAFESMHEGRSCEVSGACHWAINAVAAAGQGRMWGRAYSVAPGGIYVRPSSPVRRPEELRHVEIGVGLHSGSHYSTLQSLEGVFPAAEVRLRFTGRPEDRLDLMLDGELEAANLFGAPMYVVEQQGFRKVLDTTFMVAFHVTGGAQPEDVERYVSALVRAQRDIDEQPQRYKHYHLKELPERLHPLVDVRSFGLGERIVVEPYTRTVYERTQRWMIDAGVLPLEPSALRPYEEAVLA
jgi:NitT/TauT family transport system substrate-binding protein